MSYQEIVGYDEIVGDQYGTRMVVAGDRPNGVLVRNTPPNRARQFPLGFPSTAIAASATATITAQTQVIFRPRRLVIPSDIAGSLLVNDFKVGKNSMFPSADPIPARVFSETAVGVDLQLDTAQVSQIISLLMENTSGASVTFTAAIIGDAIE